MKKNPSSLDDISFEIITDSTKFNRKTLNGGRTKKLHVEEFPFHEEVNSKDGKRSRDLSSQNNNFVDSHSTANFRFESSDQKFSNKNMNEYRPLVSTKAYGSSNLVRIILLNTNLAIFKKCKPTQ